jgi:DNA mismatch repair protein MutS2
MNVGNDESLEYQSLKHILAHFADSPLGAQLVRKLAPSSDRCEIQKQFKLVKECLQLLTEGLAPRFLGLFDAAPQFEKLRVEGAALSPKEVLEILGLLVCSESIKNLLRRCATTQPNLLEIGTSIPDLRVLTAQLSGKINESGELEDHASPALKRIRNEISVVRGRVCRSLEQILKRESESGLVQDDVITIRNERFVIPVKSESRKELAGVVHGTSSSGSTVFLEPLEVLELNNQLIQLKERANDEIQRILLSLSDAIRNSLPDLQSAVRLLGLLDFSFAKARFCQRYRCVIPEVNEGNVLSLAGGRHPVLEDALQAQGSAIVPISIDLNDTRKVLVISGPNTGGKTIVLKTIGLLTLMALSGVPVPAESANICIFQQVFTDIGDHQSISENLSTFSSHLLNIRAILGKVTAPALVLLDELGTGTDPAEGSALGVAIVENLRKRGITTVVTTHHNGLKMYASKTPGVLNASVEFDEATLRPTYRLIHGVPGNSSGLEIARRLGLEEELLTHAQQLISREERDVAEYSRQLKGEITKISTLRQQIDDERKNLETRRTQLEQTYAELEKTKRREIEQASQRAWEMFQKEAKKVIDEIQDKYVVVRARREAEKKLSQLHQKVQQQPSPPEVIATSSLSRPDGASDMELQVGSRVFLRSLGQEGILVAALKDQRWEVAVGNLKCVVLGAELQPLGKLPVSETKRPELNPSAWISVQVNNSEPPTNEINLLGCTVDEAINQADKFLDRAFLASISQVRLIHGSGMGILRKAIAEWLSEQPHVAKFQMAAPNEGGKGVTVVSLKV